MRRITLNIGLWIALSHLVGLPNLPTAMGQEQVDDSPQLVDQSPPLVDVWVNSAKGFLYENDLLNVIVEPVGGKNVFVYLIYVDAEGDPILIFPNHYERDNRVAAGRRRELPSKGSRFRIAGPLGDEVLLAIATPHRLAELESLVGTKPGPLPVVASETLYDELIPKWHEEGVDIFDKQFETRPRDAEGLQSGPERL